jgi:hypothetical protein
MNQDAKCLTCGAPKSAHIGGRGRSTVSADCLEFSGPIEETAVRESDPDDAEIASVGQVVAGATAETIVPIAAGIVRRLLARVLPPLPGPTGTQAELDRLTIERLSHDLDQARRDRDANQEELDALRLRVAELQSERAEPGDVADAIDRLVSVLREQISINDQVLAFMKELKPKDPA